MLNKPSVKSKDGRRLFLLKGDMNGSFWEGTSLDLSS